MRWLTNANRLTSMVTASRSEDGGVDQHLCLKGLQLRPELHLAAETLRDVADDRHYPRDLGRRHR